MGRRAAAQGSSGTGLWDECSCAEVQQVYADALPLLSSSCCRAMLDGSRVDTAADPVWIPIEGSSGGSRLAAAVKRRRTAAAAAAGGAAPLQQLPSCPHGPQDDALPLLLSGAAAVCSASSRAAVRSSCCTPTALLGRRGRRRQQVPSVTWLRHMAAGRAGHARPVALPSRLLRPAGAGGGGLLPSMLVSRAQALDGPRECMAMHGPTPYAPKGQSCCAAAGWMGHGLETGHGRPTGLGPTPDSQHRAGPKTQQQQQQQQQHRAAAAQARARKLPGREVR
jgi:hypothetical protein